MRKLIFFLFELVIIASAIWLAHSFENSIQYIPKGLISLPQVDYSSSDLITLYIYFIVVHAIVFFLSNIVSGTWVISSASSSAGRIFVLMLGYSLSTLSLFLTSSSNFDPNLVVGIALFSGMFYLLIGVLGGLKLGPVTSIKNLLENIIKRAFTISGVLIIFLTLTPAILAGAFVKDRDFANTITQLRMQFSNTDSVQYGLVSAVGDLRFKQPMLVKSPETDSNSLYILQRNGQIFRLSRQQNSTPDLIIDLTQKVGFIEMENGALGFDFHPKFSHKEANFPYLYVYYTSVHDGLQKNYLSRFDLSKADVKNANDSETVLMELNRESSGFHNGGSVEFGDDGFLYLAIGEGVRTPTQKHFSNTLRMGVLRIDVDQQGGEISRPIRRSPENGHTKNYYIPLDNPFLNNPEILEEYWAVGLRNPFRISFDSHQQQWWGGDVGSTKWEEINILEAGRHYQFPFIEGPEETGSERPNTLLGRQKTPVYSYFHTATERAIIGGVVYRGNKFQELNGYYLFADNYSGNLYRLERNATVTEKVTLAASNDYAQRGISSVTQHPSGEIYVTTLGKASGKTGKVLKLVRGSATETADKDSNLESLTSADVSEIYATNCARCHGASGKGDGPDQKLLNVTIADFTNPNYGQRRSQLEIESIIAEGGSGNGLSPMMPPWNVVLNDNEIRSLATYIRSMN